MADDGGLSRLQRRLAAIPAEVRKAAQPAVLRQAEEMAQTMRQVAPDDPATDAPDLHTSIAVTPGGQSTPDYSQPGGAMVVPENAAAITVGNHAVRYPHLVEYGTAKAPAQPFFWPSVRLHQAKAKRAIKAAIGRAVRKNWGKS